MPAAPNDSNRLQQVLQERFGFATFRDGQEAVIGHLLEGRSALAVFPTGSGKSLCYQLPALLLDGLTLVVSPLIALMKDQTDFLAKRGIPAARLDSTVTTEEFATIQESLRNGSLKLLYVAPERFSNERFLARLKSLRIDLLVIDEAHCISEWGHNFRPDYLKLARLAWELRVGRVLALTATATPDVAKDICRAFEIEAAAHVHTGFYRPNLFLRATASSADQKLTLLRERLRSRPIGPTIVYVTLQKTAESVAAALAEDGFGAAAYHAGMETEEREAVQNRFMASRDGVVVATIAFGMGIDKADIRSVYHYNLPKSVENYAQEIGRAGRDGQPSYCEVLASGEDLTVLENFTYGDTPTPRALEGLLHELMDGRAAGDVFDIAMYELSGRHDIRQLVASTALTYLELDGILASTTPFYTSYQWQFRKSTADILARFDPERQTFLQGLFNAAKVGRTWHTLDVEVASKTLRCERERIVKALGYLEEKKDIELRAAGVRQGYRVLRVPADMSQLSADFVRRFSAREKTDIARVTAMAELWRSEGCLVHRLLAYFGEELGRDCGHCGRCEGDPVLALKRPEPRFSLPMAELKTLRQEHPGALADPRQATRFLCGIASPALTKAKLTRHPVFGSLQHVPFAAVLESVA